jgi:hypothetical protein
LESELDRLFIKTKNYVSNVSQLPTPTLTPIKHKQGSEPTEMKDYLKEFLKANAQMGIESSELRQKVPKQLIDSENLAKIIGELEKERKIRVQNLQALHLDPNRLHFFDKEALEAVKNTLRRRYKSQLVEGNYPLDILFEEKPHLKERVMLTEFANILTMTFIVWVD